MADNVQANAGSGGATFRTDEVSAGVHVPYTKLMSGTDGATDLIAGDAANGLDVDVTRLPALAAGTNNIGDVDILTIAAGDNNIGNVDIVTMPSVTLNALPAGTNNIGDVDVLTLPALPAGTNNIGDVDVLSIAAGDNNIGNVDIVTMPSVTLNALPAGTNNIGDVDVLTVPTDPFGANADAASASGSISAKLRQIATTGIPVTGTVTVGAHAVTNAGTFATQVDGAALTALQLIDDVVKLEDAAHSSGDAGVMALGVRRDANTTLADTTGDYAPFQLDASGSLKVAIISGAGSGGTSATDDAAFSVASGSGTPIMGLADETGPDAVDEGDVGVVRMTLQRGLHVNLRDASGAEVSVGGGTQYDEDTVHSSGDKLTLAGAVRRDTAASGAADGDRVTINTDSAGKLWTNAEVTVALPAGTNNIGDVDVLSLPALPAGSNNIGDVDVLTVPTDPFGANADAASATGSISAKLRFIASTGIPVTGTVTVGSHAVTNAGTFATQAGQVAHDAAASGNPVMVAARANANEPTAVSTDGDSTHLWADLLGRLVVQIGHPNPEAPVTLNATSSGDTTVIASPGASLSLHICKGSIHNRAASNVVVALTDGAAGTARFKAEIASEGGAVGFSFGSRGWKLTANTLLAVNLGGASDVDINITEYYIAA